MESTLTNYQLVEENARLKAELKELRLKIAELAANPVHSPTAGTEAATSQGPGSERAQIPWEGVGHTLTKAQLERYSRQILLPSFGVKAQEAVCRASVLVVGAGGLGCPAAVYLASCGVATLGIVDKEVVEVSNLHRQILHTEATLGVHKAESAAAACRAINSTIKVVAHTEGFLPGNALQLAGQYDVVVDASDNAATRYLISDVCCVLGLPLVSGAAIGTDGQLTVYCHGDGPCYRCLFPQPPAPGNCSSCSEAGVLGPVPGFIGVLQALETIKLITGVGTVASQKLLVVDCLSGRFTSVKLRPKQASCACCGPHASITRETIPAYSYTSFTGQPHDDKGSKELVLLPDEARVSPEGYASTSGEFVTLDVRPTAQYNAMHIPGSVHLPYDENSPEKFQQALAALLKEDGCTLQQDKSVVVVCRMGNDSQRVAHIMQQQYGFQAKDLRGGLLAISKQIDASFPVI